MNGIIAVQSVQNGVLYTKVRCKTANIEFKNAEILKDFIERAAVVVPALQPATPRPATQSGTGGARCPQRAWSVVVIAMVSAGLMQLDHGVARDRRD